MTRSEVLYLLYAINKRPSTLARIWGVSRGLVGNSMAGFGSRSVRVKIARLLAMPPSAIWGDVSSREQIVVDNDMYFNPEFYQDSK